MKNFVIIFLIILSIGCRKKCTDPSKADCDNYDPCYGYPERAAEFIVAEDATPTPWYWEYLDYDTVYSTAIRFIAKYPEEAGVSYEWQIGSETIKDQHYVVRSGFPDNVDITVRLIVSHNNSNCYGAKTRDTVYRTFHTVPTSRLPRYCSLEKNIPIKWGNGAVSYFDAWVSMFKGKYIDFPEHTEEFTIRYANYNNSQAPTLDTMYNLPYPGYCPRSENRGYATYNYFYYFGSRFIDCRDTLDIKKSGIFLFKMDRNNNKKVFIENQIPDSNNHKKIIQTYHWEGEKIN